MVSTAERSISKNNITYNSVDFRRWKFTKRVLILATMLIIKTIDFSLPLVFNPNKSPINATSVPSVENLHSTKDSTKKLTSNNLFNQDLKIETRDGKKIFNLGIDRVLEMQGDEFSTFTESLKVGDILALKTPTGTRYILLKGDLNGNINQLALQVKIQQIKRESRILTININNTSKEIFNQISKFGLIPGNILELTDNSGKVLKSTKMVGNGNKDGSASDILTRDVVRQIVNPLKNELKTQYQQAISSLNSQIEAGSKQVGSNIQSFFQGVQSLAAPAIGPQANHNPIKNNLKTVESAKPTSFHIENKSEFTPLTPKYLASTNIGIYERKLIFLINNSTDDIKLKAKNELTNLYETKKTTREKAFNIVSICLNETPSKTIYIGDSRTAALPIGLDDCSNIAIPGTTTGEWLGNSNQIVKGLKNNPNIKEIYIALGFNDLKQGKSAEETLSNIRETISRIKSAKPNIKITLMAALPPDVNFYNKNGINTPQDKNVSQNVTPVRLNALNRGLSDLAQQMPSTKFNSSVYEYVNLCMTIGKQITHDGVHFNSEINQGMSSILNADKEAKQDVALSKSVNIGHPVQHLEGLVNKTKHKLDQTPKNSQNVLEIKILSEKLNVYSDALKQAQLEYSKA